jgi:energy-coupling factor transporter transmembrane protein EcfT
MRTKILFKIFLILPLILIVDYVLMVLLGCATCLFGFGNDFYCGTYCLIGKVILLLSAILVIFFIVQDIKHYLNHNKNAKAL